jgi:hypothetical protein
MLSDINKQIIKFIFSPLGDRRHDECAEAGAADGNAGGEGALLLKVHGHAHNSWQVDKAESKPCKKIFFKIWFKIKHLRQNARS